MTSGVSGEIIHTTATASTSKCGHFGLLKVDRNTNYDMKNWEYLTTTEKKKKNMLKWNFLVNFPVNSLLLCWLYTEGWD